MRPKKIILCVDDSEQDLSTTKFMLETNGYRVLATTKAFEAISMFRDNSVELVLVDQTIEQMKATELIEKLKRIASYIPMILLVRSASMNDEINVSGALLTKENTLPAELLERIKVLSARKRGRRKGSEAAMRCGHNRTAVI